MKYYSGDNLRANLNGGEGQYEVSINSQWDWKAWDSVGTMMDVPSLINYWKDKNNCQSSIENNPASGIHVVHDNCDANVRVEHYGLAGVEHGWPGSINGVSTHQLIWNFVSAFKRP